MKLTHISVLNRVKVRTRLCENPVWLQNLSNHLLCHRKWSLVGVMRIESHTHPLLTEQGWSLFTEQKRID